MTGINLNRSIVIDAQSVVRFLCVCVISYYLADVLFRIVHSMEKIAYAKMREAELLEHIVIYGERE